MAIKLLRHRRHKHPCFPSRNQAIRQQAAGLLSAVRRPQRTKPTRAAHAFAVQSGLKVDTEEYFKFCDDALELYGQRYNGITI